MLKLTDITSDMLIFKILKFIGNFLDIYKTSVNEKIIGKQSTKPVDSMAFCAIGEGCII